MSKYFMEAYARVCHGHGYDQHGGVGFFALPSFTRSGLVNHGVSARIGGVSEGCYASLNLSFTRPDELHETVMENHRIFARAAGIEWGSMVMDAFEHGTCVREVNSTHAGAGYLKPPLMPCDGLVTDDPAIALITGHADCLPLFFLDPVKRCIGLAHAGWKGTLHQIALEVIRQLTQTYKSKPENLIVGVGPCICKKCFEVDEALAEQFRAAFPEVSCVSPGKEGKAHIDLAMVSVAQFLSAGILPEHITLMDACTFEDPERLYSHRRDKGDTGGMAAFLQLIPEKDAFLYMQGDPARV